jgi:hypothetical protein
MLGGASALCTPVWPRTVISGHFNHGRNRPSRWQDDSVVSPMPNDCRSHARSRVRRWISRVGPKHVQWLRKSLVGLETREELEGRSVARAQSSKTSETDEALLRKNRHLTPTPAKPNESPHPWDRFATFNGPRVCEDRNGRWRRDHNLDKDGKCLFCDKVIQDL